MYKLLWILPILFILQAFGDKSMDKKDERRAIAERYFQGVFGCDLSVIDELAGEDILVSYPVFEAILNTYTNKGRDAVREFHEGFCKRWTDTKTTVHESIAEGNAVVLVWSFSGRNVSSIQRGDPDDKQIQTWGGISVYHFDESDKIVAEFGEESHPGPYKRLAMAGISQ